MGTFAEFVAAETIETLRGNQKPFVVFVAGRNDRLFVIIGSGRRIGFVLDEFVHLRAVFFQGQGGKTAECQVGDAVVVHVGVGIIGAVMVVLQIVAIVVFLEKKWETWNSRGPPIVLATYV